MASLDTLMNAAEIAIAIAGFSAVIIVLRRDENGKWADRDIDQFHGMLVHAVFAVGFCFLPTLVNVIVQDPVTSLHIACGILGIQIIAHSVGAMFLATTTRAGIVTLIVGVLIGFLQFAAFADWGAHRELDIYLVGIIWHILQAGMLFVILVWITRETDEQG